MARTREVAALLLSGTIGSLCAQAALEWRLERDANGVRIESRAVLGWDIREMRGTARFDGRLSSLVAVIEDPSTAPLLNDFVVESKVVRRDGVSRYQVYTLTRMPWPLKDRDVVTQRVIERDGQTGAVTIIDEAVAGGMPENKGFIRIKRSHNRWSLTPAANGGVQIELLMLSDPAGPIPSSLISSMSVTTPFRMIEKLKALAQRPPYSEAADLTGEAKADATFFD
jgi:hypothetical protein